MGITIRSYQPEDLPRILELTAEGFQGVSIDYLIEQRFGHVEPGWQQRKLGDVSRSATQAPEGVFIATQDNMVIGYVTVALNRSKSIGSIGDLAVDAKLRNKGIGRQLLERALTYIREQGMQFAKIETLDVNAAGQALYPKLGFQEVARQIHYVMRVNE